MKGLFIIAILMFWGMVSLKVPVYAMDNKLVELNNISKIVGPAVLYIETYDRNNQPYKSGSGFIIENNGKIITNYHVINNAYSAKVKLADGRIFDIEKVLNYDEDKDIAILKINTNNLPIVQQGDSDNIMSGERIIVIGSPLGLENTISEGIISNSKRILMEKNYIQTTAPISPGSSGGPLLNDKGEVIGIMTLSNIYGQNINFAIPINEIKLYLKENLNIYLRELTKKKSPSKPTGVWAKVSSKKMILVGWDHADNVDFYHAYFSENRDGPYTVLCDSNGLKEQFCWDKDYCFYMYDLPTNKTIFFKITAVKNNVESDFSDIAHVTTCSPYQATNSKVECLKFYESGDEDIPLGKRIYKTAFSKFNARYIELELSLIHPAPKKRLNFPLKIVYYNSDGSINGEFIEEFYIDSDWFDSQHDAGWGSSIRGTWSVGEYTVKIFDGDNEIATGKFKIE
jgi:hypothetical protein